MKKSFLTFLLFIAFRQFSLSCICPTEMKNIDTLWEKCPVIFVGEYVGWDWYNLRSFKIIEAIKGLPTHTENLIMNDASCNLRQIPGRYYLIFAFGERADHEKHLYFSFTNCDGTREVTKDYKNLDDYNKLMECVKKYGNASINLAHNVDFDSKRKMLNSLETFFHNQLDKTEYFDERNARKLAEYNKNQIEIKKRERIMANLKAGFLYGLLGILIVTCVLQFVKIRKLNRNK